MVYATQILPRAATILPRGACTLTLFFARGLKHMLAGLVLKSIIVGVVTTASAFALSLPGWVALMLYPAACSLTLLTLAYLTARRGDDRAQSGSMIRQQA